MTHLNTTLLFDLLPRQGPLYRRVRWGRFCRTVPLMRISSQETDEQILARWLGHRLWWDAQAGGWHVEADHEDT